jgi:periplasmic protein TonB
MNRVVIIVFSLIICNYSNAQQPSSVVFDTIYTKVDVLPTYPNGNEGWKKYLKKNLKYPKKAWWDELESDVVMEFIVRKDGTVTNIRHLTVFGWGFEEEATRLLQNCGKWNPATKNGKPVDYKGTITIPFRLRTSKGEKE